MDLTKVLEWAETVGMPWTFVFVCLWLLVKGVRKIYKDAKPGCTAIYDRLSTFLGHIEISQESIVSSQDVQIKLLDTITKNHISRSKQAEEIIKSLMLALEIVVPDDTRRLIQFHLDNVKRILQG